MNTIDIGIGLSLDAFNSILLAIYYAAFLVPRSHKYPRFIIFSGFGLVFFLTCCLRFWLVFYAGLMIPTNIPSLLFSHHILPLMHMVVLYFLSFGFFKSNAGVRVFLVCSYFAIHDICHFISQGISFFGRSFVVAQSIRIVIYIALFLLSLQVIIKNFPHKNLSYQWVEILYIILPCVSGLALISIIKTTHYKIDMSGNLVLAARVPFYEVLIPLAGLVFLFSLTAAVRLFQKLAEWHIEEKEKLVLQKQTQQLQEQFRDIDSIYTEIKGMRHDMKSHLYNIRLLVKSVMEGNTENDAALEKYFGKFEDTFNKFEMMYQTGSGVSDIIIQQKHLESSTKGIDFSADFIYPAFLNLDAYDVGVILNNGLENAIEACGSMKGLAPYIRLRAYVKGEMFIIEIENSFKDQLIVDEHTHLPVSNKPDKKRHGMGLSNIQRCARKYYGDIDFQITNDKNYNVFHLTVMLQGKE